MYSTITYEVNERVAYVTFNTPKSLNSITEQRLEDLEKAVAAVREDQNVRALVITGNGRAFCVGLDLDFLKRAFYDIQLFERTIRRLGKILLDFEDLPVPVIAAVNGLARAGGFEIALAADLMLIAEEAQIGDHHTHVGVMPGGACLHRLRERVGEQRAKDIVWNARWLNGKEAVACGLALQTVPLAELPAAIEELVKDLRHRPRECLGAIKSMLHAGRYADRKAAAEMEIQNFTRYMGTLPFGREGYEASLQNRNPSWY